MRTRATNVNECERKAKQQGRGWGRGMKQINYEIRRSRGKDERKSRGGQKGRIARIGRSEEPRKPITDPERRDI